MCFCCVAFLFCFKEIFVLLHKVHVYDREKRSYYWNGWRQLLMLSCVVAAAYDTSSRTLGAKLPGQLECPGTGPQSHLWSLHIWPWPSSCGVSFGAWSSPESSRPSSCSEWHFGSDTGGVQGRVCVGVTCGILAWPIVYITCLHSKHFVLRSKGSIYHGTFACFVCVCVCVCVRWRDGGECELAGEGVAGTSI